MDAARTLSLPLLCVHTPSDNCVTGYLQGLLNKKKPRQLKDVLQLLQDLFIRLNTVLIMLEVCFRHALVKKDVSAQNVQPGFKVSECSL